jgi:hypothetical protein
MKSGDRARANKQTKKRRVRRQEIQILRRAISPAKAAGIRLEEASVPEPKAEDLA